MHSLQTPVSVYNNTGPLVGVHTNMWVSFYVPQTPVNTLRPSNPIHALTLTHKPHPHSHLDHQTPSTLSLRPSNPIQLSLRPSNPSPHSHLDPQTPSTLSLRPQTPSNFHLDPQTPTTLSLRPQTPSNFHLDPQTPVHTLT